MSTSRTSQLIRLPRCLVVFAIRGTQSSEDQGMVDRSCRSGKAIVGRHCEHIMRTHMRAGLGEQVNTAAGTGGPAASRRHHEVADRTNSAFLPPQSGTSSLGRPPGRKEAVTVSWRPRSILPEYIDMDNLSPAKLQPPLPFFPSSLSVHTTPVIRLDHHSSPVEIDLAVTSPTQM